MSELDLVLRNIHIPSVVSATHTGLYDIGIRGGKIAALAKKGLLSAPLIYNADGAFVSPGFVESHAHLFNIGRMNMMVDLHQTLSEEECCALMAKRANSTPPGQWLFGRGWNQNAWQGRLYPSTKSLSKAVPHHPVILTRLDGHSIWVNDKAMDLAGISYDTKAPFGGEILKDSDGSLKGIFIDHAIDLFQAFINPKEDPETKAHLLQLAQDACLRLGITSFHDAQLKRDDLFALMQLERQGTLTLSLNGMIDGLDQSLVSEFLQKGPYLGPKLRLKTVKLFADGALGSHGALLKEPYHDRKDTLGLSLIESDSMLALVREVALKGFQVATHAIGDKAVAQVMDVYEAYLGPNHIKDHRFRIEHAELVDLEEITRMAKYRVIASVQSTHCTSDMVWLRDRIGEERCHKASPWRSMLDAGVVVCNGSDAPIDNLNPLSGIFAAVTRQDHNFHPKEGFYGKECMTLAEAHRAQTTWGAYAEFAELQKGRLEEGFDADLVLFDKNPYTGDPKDLLDTCVIKTMVRGEWA